MSFCSILMLIIELCICTLVALSSPCPAVLLPSHPVVQHHICPAVQLSGCPVVKLHSCPGVQSVQASSLSMRPVCPGVQSVHASSCPGVQSVQASSLSRRPVCPGVQIDLGLLTVTSISNEPYVTVIYYYVVIYNTVILVVYCG